jgi:integrase
MARQSKRLTARRVATLKSPGWHADGDGLYLRIDARGIRRWVFVFRRGAKRSEMGLGPAAAISLAEARTAAEQVRETLRQGVDPIAERRNTRATEGLETFGAFADRYIADHSPAWKNDKHIAQWRMTLKVHAAPLRQKSLAEISTPDVLEVLKPLWTATPETASRLRGRIERVLDAAKAAGLREGENPARWRGHLSHLLSKPKKLTRGHQKAMSPDDIPSLMATLRARSDVSARALEFTILTATRTGEVIRARADEFDLDAGIWKIPADRSKTGKELRIALVPRTCAIARELWPTDCGGFIFRRPAQGVRPPRKKGAPAHLSNAAMYELMKQLFGPTYTVHGFRSTFRDWVGDNTEFPRELAEHALGHIVGDESENAYRRGDALERRRAMMEAWAHYCLGKPVQ